MSKMLEFICRIHVIVRNFANHKREERFFPVMFISFWLNIVGQSIAFLIYVRLPGYSSDVVGSETTKAILIALFFATILFISWVVNNVTRYEKSEKWFEAKSKNQQDFLVSGGVISMLVCFFSLLIWMLVEM